MNDKGRYTTRGKKMLALALETRDTRGWGNYPSAEGPRSVLKLTKKGENLITHPKTKLTAKGVLAKNERDHFEGNDENECNDSQGNDDNERDDFQGNDENERGDFQRKDENEHGDFKGNDENERDDFQGNDENERDDFQGNDENERDDFQGKDENERDNCKGNDENERDNCKGNDENERDDFQGNDENDTRSMYEDDSILGDETGLSTTPKHAGGNMTVDVINDDTPDERYEYLHNGTVIGLIEICTESKPGLIVHRKPLSEVEVKVKVLERYDVVTDHPEIDEFHPGAFLALSKVKLRKRATKKVGVKRRGRGSKIGASPSKWTIKKRKLFRNSGKPYENEKGVKMPGKSLKEKPCKSCKFTDCTEVTEKEREEVFTSFYNSKKTFDEQNSVITHNVKIGEKKTAKATKEGVKSRPKGVSRKYLINGKNVCKGLFLATYCISNGRLERVLQKVQANTNEVPKDKIGKHGNHQVINVDVYKILVEMIGRLPKYISHYSREKHNDNTLYLQPGTVIASKGKRKETSLFHLLVEECEERGVMPPKVTWFRRTMKSKFSNIKVKT